MEATQHPRDELQVTGVIRHREIIFDVQNNLEGSGGSRESQPSAGKTEKWLVETH